MSNEDVVPVLNNLIETCKDGQNGFQTAAQGISRDDLKLLFENYAQQRAQFAGELQQAVRSVGGDPENRGSIAGTLHRGWINIASIVTGRNDLAVIAECERGEDSAVANYKDALEVNLPPAIQAMVHRQYLEVKAAHDRIRSIERAAIQSA
jgi:uncharacterized protein (TIGR02284 family)